VEELVKNAPLQLALKHSTSPVVGPPHLDAHAPTTWRPPSLRERWSSCAGAMGSSIRGCTSRSAGRDGAGNPLSTPRNLANRQLEFLARRPNARQQAQRVRSVGKKGRLFHGGLPVKRKLVTGNVHQQHNGVNNFQCATALVCYMLHIRRMFCTLAQTLRWAEGSRSR
jgi:hypothetical protein